MILLGLEFGLVFLFSYGFYKLFEVKRNQTTLQLTYNEVPPQYDESPPEYNNIDNN